VHEYIVRSSLTTLNLASASPARGAYTKRRDYGPIALIHDEKAASRRTSLVPCARRPARVRRSRTYTVCTQLRVLTLSRLHTRNCILNSGRYQHVLKTLLHREHKGLGRAVFRLWRLIDTGLRFDQVHFTAFMQFLLYVALIAFSV
jgi:hypothetical protein